MQSCVCFSFSSFYVCFPALVWPKRESPRRTVGNSMAEEGGGGGMCTLSISDAPPLGGKNGRTVQGRLKQSMSLVLR